MALNHVQNEIYQNKSLPWNESNLGEYIYALFSFYFGEQTQALDLAPANQAVEIKTANPARPNDRYLCIEGTFNSLANTASVKARCTFFEYDGQGEIYQDVLIEIAPPQPTFIAYLKTIHDEPDGSLEALLTGAASPNAALPRNPLLRQCDYGASGEFKLLFSSTDTIPDFVPAPGEFESILTGLNIPIALTFADAPATLLNYLGIAANQRFMMSIGASESGEAEITLSKVLTLQTPELAGFALKLSQASLSFSLYHLFSDWPQLLLAGTIELGFTPLAWHAKLDLNNKQLSITLEEFPTFAEAVEPFGLGDLIQRFPGPLDALGQVQIRTLTFDIDLEGKPELSLVATEIVTDDAISILPGIVSARLLLDAKVFSPLTPHRYVEAHIFGEWQLGETRFNCRLTYPAYDFYADMDLGQALDSSMVTDKVFPGVTLPAITLLDMELDANFKARTFEAEVTADTDWSLELLPGKTLAIEDIEFELEYGDSRVQACELGAELNFAGVKLRAFGEYDFDGGWHFGAQTYPGEVLPIGHLLAEVADKFGDIALPGVLNETTLYDLNTRFNTRSKRFNLQFTTAVNINDTAIDLLANLTIKRYQSGAYTKQFTGYMAVGKHIFDTRFQQLHSRDLMLASYSDTAGSEVDLSELLNSILPSPLVPTGITLTLNQALLAHLPAPRTVTQTTKQKRTKATPTSVFLIDVGNGINLSNLPLVGSVLRPNQTVALKYQLHYAHAQTSSVSTQEIALINQHLPEGTAPIITGEKGLKKGLGITVNMQMGSEHFPLDLGLSTADSPPESGPQREIINTGGQQSNTTGAPALIHTYSDSDAASPISNNTTAKNQSIKWINLQKTLGPVHFNRIGVRYTDNKLWCLLDAALVKGGLTLSLDGLGVGSKLTEFTPTFTLNGIGIAFRHTALAVSGAFLRSQRKDTQGQTYDEYSGTASLKLNKLSIAALGSYTRVQGAPSLFVYALLNYPLGGPSFFFVTGLAAGFGYNRRLLTPTIEHVSDFPLVAQALQGKGLRANADNTTLLGILESLHTYIPPKTGELFFAVGIKFSTFKIIDSFALLTLATGDHPSLNLLGVSTLVVPPKAGNNALAVIQLTLKATYRPEEGALTIDGRLTPQSYIFNKDCHLTGGFAFYSWFEGEHAGDFIVTLGGYHPKFHPPAHYPKVPRLAFNWIVDKHLTVKGDMYFALCPHALMAGGHLAAIYEAGPFKAWFTIGADFLISWKPYHYDAEIYVDMGASLTYHFFGTHHITIHLGADLHVWGPEFAGTAKVHIWVVTVSIDFGDKNTEPPLLTWNEFKEGFLPHNTNDNTSDGQKILSINITNGFVTASVSQTTGDTPETLIPESLGVINPKYFALSTDSVIPCNQFIIGTNTQSDTNMFRREDELYSSNKETKQIQPLAYDDEANALINPKIPGAGFHLGAPAIAPMGVNTASLTTTLRLTITKKTDSGDEDVEGDFIFTPILKKMPAALWGSKQAKDLNLHTDPAFIERALTGFTIIPKTPIVPTQGKPLARKDLAYDLTTVAAAFNWEQATNTDILNTLGLHAPDAKQQIAAISGDPDHSRAGLLTTLDMNDLLDFGPTPENNFMYITH